MHLSRQSMCAPVLVLLFLIPMGNCDCVNKGKGNGYVECTGVFPKLAFISSPDVYHLKIHDVTTLPTFRLTPSFFSRNRNLMHVESIQIIRTTLSSVEKNAFSGLKYLTYLDLSNNHLLELVHQEAVSEVTDLMTLSLSNNVKLFKKVSGPILISDSLKELDISRCEIEQLSSKAFDKLKSLTYINLAHNKLGQISPPTFSGHQHLIELDLSYNLLNNLPWYMLQNSTEIRTLNLKGNPISEVPKDIFPDSTDFDLTLDLGETELTAIHIPPLKSLIYLNLGGSLVSSLTSLSDFPELKYLNLSHTKITKLHSYSFEHNPHLETIHLSRLAYLALPVRFNGSFPYLYFMDISDCGLDHLMPNLFVHMTSIATLNLSRNALHNSESLGRALFPLRELEVLDLTHNELRSIGEEDFSGNGYLKKLLLSGNPFVSPPSLASTPSLSKLDLSHCTLTRIHLPDIFKHEQYLQVLSLSGNNLSSLIDETYLDQFGDEENHWKLPGEFMLLDLSENPLSCDPSFISLIDEVIHEGVQPSHEPPQRSRASEGFGRDLAHEWEQLRQQVCALPHYDVAITLKPLNLPPELVHGTITAKFPIGLTISFSVAVAIGLVALLIILTQRQRKNLHPIQGPINQQKVNNVSIAAGGAGGMKLIRGAKDYQRLQEDRSPSSPMTPRIYKPPQKGVHFTFPDIPDSKDQEGCEDFHDIVKE